MCKTIGDVNLLFVFSEGSEAHGYELTYTLLEKGPHVTQESAKQVDQPAKNSSAKDKAFNFYR